MVNGVLEALPPSARALLVQKAAAAFTGKLEADAASALGDAVSHLALEAGDALREYLEKPPSSSPAADARPPPWRAMKAFDQRLRPDWLLDYILLDEDIRHGVRLRPVDALWKHSLAAATSGYEDRQQATLRKVVKDATKDKDAAKAEAAQVELQSRQRAQAERALALMVHMMAVRSEQNSVFQRPLAMLLRMGNTSRTVHEYLSRVRLVSGYSTLGADVRLARDNAHTLLEAPFKDLPVQRVYVVIDNYVVLRIATLLTPDKPGFAQAPSLTVILARGCNDRKLLRLPPGWDPKTAPPVSNPDAADLQPVYELLRETRDGGRVTALFNRDPMPLPPTVHVVKKGDTLELLAEEASELLDTRITAVDIAHDNRMSKDDVLVPGQRVLLARTKLHRDFWPLQSLALSSAQASDMVQVFRALDELVGNVVEALRADNKEAVRGLGADEQEHELVSQLLQADHIGTLHPFGDPDRGVSTMTSMFTVPAVPFHVMKGSLLVTLTLHHDELVRFLFHICHFRKLPTDPLAYIKAAAARPVGSRRISGGPRGGADKEQAEETGTFFGEVDPDVESQDVEGANDDDDPLDDTDELDLVLGVSPGDAAAEAARAAALEAYAGPGNEQAARAAARTAAEENDVSEAGTAQLDAWAAAAVMHARGVRAAEAAIAAGGAASLAAAAAAAAAAARAVGLSEAEAEGAAQHALAAAKAAATAPPPPSQQPMGPPPLPPPAWRVAYDNYLKGAGTPAKWSSTVAEDLRAAAARAGSAKTRKAQKPKLTKLIRVLTFSAAGYRLIFAEVIESRVNGLLKRFGETRTWAEIEPDEELRRQSFAAVAEQPEPRNELEAALLFIRAYRPHFFHLWLACREFDIAFTSWESHYDRADYLVYTSQLPEIAAHLASAGCYKLTQWLVRSMNDLLYWARARPDLLRQLPIDVHKLNDLFAETFNSLYSISISKNVAADRILGVLKGISATARLRMELRRGMMGDKHSQSLTSMLLTEKTAQSAAQAKATEAATKYADYFTQLFGAAWKGEVEFDLFDARAVGYRVLTARPGVPGKPPAWVPPASLLGCSARMSEPYKW